MTGTAELAVPAARVFAEVADLATYPHWLGIVQSVASADDGAAWSVELGARLGPLRRSKRVRMVRTVHEPVEHVRFERAEPDEREHSAWVLDAVVEGHGEGACTLTMSLHYGGSAWLPGLDLVLRQEVRRAAARLASRF